MVLDVRRMHGGGQFGDGRPFETRIASQGVGDATGLRPTPCGGEETRQEGPLSAVSAVSIERVGSRVMSNHCAWQRYTAEAATPGRVH